LWIGCRKSKKVMWGFLAVSYDFLLGGCGNIKTIFGRIFMTLLQKSEERTTHQNWILDAETAKLFMSFYICHVPNFIPLPQTKELSIRIQGRKVADHHVKNQKTVEEFQEASFETCLPLPHWLSYLIKSIRFLFPFYLFLFVICLQSHPAS